VQRQWLSFKTIDTAVFDKPADEDEHAGHHDGHAH
jgi:chaperonin GroEL